MPARLFARRAIASIALLLVPLGLVLPTSVASAATPSSAPAPAPREPDVGRGKVLHRKPLTCTDRVPRDHKEYCRATVENIEATALGVGQPAFLGQAIVYDVGADTVGVAQRRGPICDQGTCDFFLVSVRVRWTGPDRPQENDVVDLYGTTVQGSMVVTAFEVVGYCENPYGWFC